MPGGSLIEYIKHHLKQIRKHFLDKDYDFMLGVDGYEGSGKTTLGLLMCKEIDPEFTVEQIAFDVPTFERLVWSLPKGRAILIDEGATSFFSLNTMSKEVKSGIQTLTTMRSQNHFVVICVPHFSLLVGYLKNNRLRGMIRVVNRGFCKYYSKTALKRFSKSGTKWNIPDATFEDDFEQLSGKLWEEYKLKKDAYLSQRALGTEKNEEQGEYMQIRQAATELCVRRGTLSQRCYHNKIPGAKKNLVGNWVIPVQYVKDNKP